MLGFITLVLFATAWKAGGGWWLIAIIFGLGWIGSKKSSGPTILEVKATKDKAAQGDADSRFKLGHWYKNGIGMEKNITEAFGWFTLAANQGHTNAQNQLGTMFENGEGCEQNFQIAHDWYLKAAQENNAIAQFNLGQLYSDGKGVGKNIDVAREWLVKSAQQGDADAQNELEKLDKCSDALAPGSDSQTINNFEPVEIATATLDQLLTLPGVGAAEAITLLNLQTSGSIPTSIDEMAEVLKLKPHIAKRLEGLLIFSPTSASASSLPAHLSGPEPFKQMPSPSSGRTID